MAAIVDIMRDRDVTVVTQSQLRLQTSVRLRWFAVAGQLLAVGFVSLGLGYPLPVGLCILLIAASAWLNIILRVGLTSRHRLSTGLSTALLVYDVLQLGGLLYLTGGATNPFLVLIVVPVTVSAATLPAANTIFIGLVAAAMALTVAATHWPLPWMDGGGVKLPWVYTLGVLASVHATMVFLGLYAWRLAKEARQMTTALAATELVLAREQRLHALDGLAAAAAHELGTPLATIVLTAKELERDLTAGTVALADCIDDVRLLSAQATRCRDILQKLSRAPDAPDPMHASMSVTQVIDEAAQPYRGRRTITVDAKPVAVTDGSRPATEPIGTRQPGVIYGLGNLIENAVAYAATQVAITARWGTAEVTIVIEDDGPGFSPEILDSLGDPYVTTRAIPAPTRPDAHRGTGAAKGLGLGFFIAKTLLERSGATLIAANAADARGAIVTVVWPRRGFETPKT